MSDLPTPFQALTPQTQDAVIASLKWERDELRKALEALMVAEHIDISQGLTVYQLFPERFDKARAVLAKGKATP